jgi:hypothetical protein
MVASRSLSIGMKLHLHLNVSSIISAVLFLFAFCASSTLASASPTTVQDNNGYVADTTSVAVAFGSNVTSGHVIVVAVSTYDGEALVTPTDTQGNSFTQVVTAGTSGAAVAAIYIATAKSSAADTVTCSIANSASDNIHCHIYEISGVTTTVDKTGTNSQAGTALTVSTSASTANANDYVFAYFADNHTAATYTVGTGYGDTQASEDTSGGDSGFSEDKVVTATGTQTATATGSTTDTFVNLIVTLEASGVTAATPTFSPAAGTYASAQSVTISDTTSGSTIYYTTNGTTPTTSSSVYSSAINVSSTETLEAIATASGYSQSAVGSAAYTINGPAATPTFSPAAGAYGPAQSVTISDATSGATIYYTTNGTTPSTSSSVYSSAINVSATETLEAIATAPLYMTSGVGSAAYTINGAVATPTFSPAAGTYSSTQTVTISDGTSGATIYYTTNGTTPTTSSSTYSSAIIVSATETLEAIATKASYSNSAVGSAAYTISAASIHTVQDNSGYSANGTSVAVAFGSNVASGDVVLVAVSTYDAETISAPTDTQGNSFTQLVTAGTSGAAVAAIYAATAKSSAADTVTCNISSTNNIHCHIYEVSGVSATVDKTGTSSQAGTALTVSTSASTANANDYVFAYFADNHTAATYTVGSGYGDTQASEDTSSGDSGFSEDKVVTATGTQTATATGSTTDTFVNLIVTLEASGSQPQVATPTFSPAAGAYGPAQTVTISDTTSGSTIYYTTNGTTPTTSSSVYSSAITVSSSETLEALATHSGDVNSAVGSAAYTINGAVATPTFSPAAGAYGPAQTVTISDTTSGSTIYYTTNGTTPTTSSSTYSSAITVSATETLEAIATHSGYSNSAVGSAAYTINGAVATPTFSPAAGAYGPAQTVTISDTTSGATIYYTTNGTTPTTSSSTYSSAITVSATETLEAIATHSGYSNSAVGSAAYTINGAVATPTFSPAAGTYSSAQSVTISDTTSGSTIYYTTNGSTPTTASFTYSSTINVSATETLKAIATKAGYSNSAVGSAAYTINVTQVATPGFSPAGGDYSSSQSVTISDSTSGATIYYTTNGSTPTTASSVYSSAISVTATETLEAIATHSGDTNSAVGSAAYTISTGSGTCDGMTLGTSVAGTADLNGFVPFQNATGITTLWNTNIANAAVDPNNAAIQTTAGYSGLSTHVNFGSSTSDGGIPFMIVDSSQTPSVPIYVYDYATTSDVVVAPYTTTVPIEGAAADCSGWPDAYQSDSHTNVLDRNTCWDYETYQTNRCNGLYDAAEETIWDMQNGEIRPWGWTSTDAAGLSVMAGLLKYDEAASGTIKHAIRMTMQQTKNDANGGYFVEPASHAAGTTYGAPSVEGMRVRLASSFNISGYSAINQAILTAFQQYGMIVADNGGYFYIQGATDSRWNDSDLSALAGIPSSDFTVVQMTPSYPGWDSVTAPTGSAPTISSFTASPTSVSSGTPVTFDFSVSGDSYDYIDMIGPVRLTSGSGSVTIKPTATQTYTLYSVNQYGNNGTGAGNGVTVSTPITVTVTGSVVAPPTFTPVAGTYSAATVITLNTATYPYATIYYTTDGSTPTYPPTGTTQEYPVIPQPMSAQSVGNVEDITVSASETIKAIAVAPGYSSPSAVSSATYTIN